MCITSPRPLPLSVRTRFGTRCSVFKFKGLDTDAVVLTDIGATSREFAAEQDLAFTELLYVAITRAKYRCIVLTGE